MGAAAITLSSTVIVGLILWYSISKWSNWTIWTFGVMFGNAIAGTTLGGISLVTGKSVVELAGALVRSANKMAGGNAAVTVTPALALVVISCFAASRSKTSGKVVAALAVMVGTITVGTTIGTLASQGNMVVTDTVKEGVNSFGQQVEGGGSAPAPTPAGSPTGVNAGMTVGSGG